MKSSAFQLKYSESVIKRLIWEPFFKSVLCGKLWEFFSPLLSNEATSDLDLATFRHTWLKCTNDLDLN